MEAERLTGKSLPHIVKLPRSPSVWKAAIRTAAIWFTVMVVIGVMFM